MKLKKVAQQRDALARAIGQPGEIVRGSLLNRTIRQKKGCQISIRPEQKEQVERWLANYHKVKDQLEAICELNHTLLRPEAGE